MDLTNLLGTLPLNNFTEEQKRSCILMWVALNMKLRLKEYNINSKVPTGYSTRLWAVGRGNEGNRNYMSNRVLENIKINAIGADDEEEFKSIMADLAENIIEQAIIVSEDFLRAARNARTESTRSKYIRAVNSFEYLKVVFIISVSNYTKQLINMGVDINHIFLTLRLNAMDDYKRELSMIWKEYSESAKEDVDYQRAVAKTEEIFENYERNTVINNDDLDKLADERLIYKLMGEQNINLLIDLTLDQLRERITNEIRLIPINELQK